MSGKCTKTLLPINAIKNPVRGGLVMHRSTLLHLGTLVVTPFLQKLWTFRPTFMTVQTKTPDIEIWREAIMDEKSPMKIFK